jgi:hypothetical protein
MLSLLPTASVLVDHSVLITKKARNKDSTVPDDPIGALRKFLG